MENVKKPQSRNRAPETKTAQVECLDDRFLPSVTHGLLNIGGNPLIDKVQEDRAGSPLLHVNTKAVRFDQSHAGSADRMLSTSARNIDRVSIGGRIGSLAS